MRATGDLELDFFALNFQLKLVAFSAATNPLISFLAGYASLHNFQTDWHHSVQHCVDQLLCCFVSGQGQKKLELQMINIGYNEEHFICQECEGHVVVARVGRHHVVRPPSLAASQPPVISAWLVLQRRLLCEFIMKLKVIFFTKETLLMESQ